MKSLECELLPLLRNAGLPGVVCAAGGPRELIDVTNLGHVDFESGVPMSLDTSFWIASITKVATAVAVLQLAERGAVRLEDDVARFLPHFRNLDVLTNFGLVPARATVTVGHLLSHTAGFGYEAWSRPLMEHVQRAGLPAASTGKRAALQRPLLFQPGAMWNYGIGMDWAGLLVEEIAGTSFSKYLQAHVFSPLGLRSTGFEPVAGSHLAALYGRRTDSTLVKAPGGPNPQREFDSGGAGLYSTPGDIIKLLQSLLRAHQGSRDEVLKPETVAGARRNQIGLLEVQDLPTCAPERSMDLSLFRGRPRKWSHFGLLHQEPQPGGRSAGSVSWAGIANTFFWIDFDAGLAAVVFAQVLPFLHPSVLALVDGYERSLYGALRRETPHPTSSVDRS